MGDSVEAFLKRGGKITKIETPDNNQSYDSRYRERNLHINEGQGERLENYKKKSGGKLPPSTGMYLKFRMRFGL